MRVLSHVARELFDMTACQTIGANIMTKKKKQKKNADDWSDISIRQHEHAIDYISRAFLYIFYWS